MKTGNKKFLFMLSSILLLFSLDIFSKDFHGIHSRTLVKLTYLENKMPINELKERDTLVGLSENTSQERSQFVVDVHSQFVNQWVKICLANKECFETTGNQLLYTCDSSSCDWREAANVHEGEELLSCKGTRHSVANVEEVFAEPGEEFSSVSLYPQHSFCVGESEIVAHNLFPILIGITWAIGGGITEFFISAGTAAVVASVANEIMKSKAPTHERREEPRHENKENNPAHNVAEAEKLKKGLASQQQMGESGTVIAGNDSKNKFRGADRAAKEYGGNPSDYVKKSSASHTASDGTKYETHWIENVNTGKRYEFKTKLDE